MRHIYIIAAAAALALSADVAAQTARTVTLAECLKMADTGSLSLRTGRIAVERARDMQGTAYSIDKTGISLSQDPTGGGSPDNALTFSQTFEFPTVYGARRSMLKEETRLEQERLEVTRNEVSRGVSSAYYTLLYAIEKQRILTRQVAIYKRFLYLAEAKMKAGETGRLEWINAGRLSQENEIALGNAVRDVHTARRDLQKWLNTEDEIMPAEDSLTVIEDGMTAVSDFNAASTPVLQMLEQQRRVSEKGVSVARQSFLPDISLSASTQLLLKGFNPYDIERERFEKGNFMGFEVGISVPLFFGGQRARLKAAKRDVELAESQIAEQEQALNIRFRTACDEYRKARASLEYYRSQGSAQADEIERISQTAYENGAIGYVEYIQNLQTAVDIRNKYATAINDYNQAVITLNYIKGNLK